MPFHERTNMDHHFSQQWSHSPDLQFEKLPLSNAANLKSYHASPPSEISEDDTVSTTSSSSTLYQEKEQSKRPRKNLKSMMRQLFSRKYNNASNPHKALGQSKHNFSTASIASAKESRKPAREAKQGREKDNAWKRLTIVVRPPKLAKEIIQPDNESAHSDDDAKPKSIHDSKFSSLASLQSLNSNSITLLPSTSSRDPSPTLSTLLISTPDLHTLQSLVSKATLILRSQEFQTDAFSTNLAGLFAEKEHQITASRRLDSETKATMIDALNKVRDVSAKTFCRKSIFLERSLSVLASLSNTLASATPAPLPSPTTFTFQITVPEIKITSPSKRTSSPPVQAHPIRDFAIPTSLERFEEAIKTLKNDLTAHSHLDPGLRNTIVQPCQDRSFPSTESERLALKRFVRFVDSRAKVLAGGYWDMGRCVREIESVVWGLEP